jgi:hypothetical protein
VNALLRRAAVPAGVAALVALLAQLPMIRTKLFYFWDDSAAQFIPMYRALGEQVLAGNWPTQLDPAAWMGGNLSAEAMFGEWNPVNVLNYVLVASLPDLAVAAAIVKTEHLVLLAVGTYLLCREYGAARWAAAPLAVALPFSGFTLYFEAASWAAGLISFSWVPLLWWSLRRYLNGKLLAIWPFVIGFLTITSGNPYGLLAVGVVVFGLIVEQLLTRQRIWGLLAIAACLGGVALLVFLPLIGNASVSWRASRELFNNGQLVPSMGDLFNASMPSHQPKIIPFAAGSIRMEVPAVYFAWFVLPLLPWLRWSKLRGDWRRIAAPVTIAAVYLALCLGPSNFWWFRWPLRLVEYLFLALAVVFAVLLSSKLATDHVRRRAGVTAALLLASGYLSFASWPKMAKLHLVSILVLAGLVTLVVVLSRKGPRWTSGVLLIGTAAVLVLQLLWFPFNRSMAGYPFPTNAAELDRLGHRYQGTTLQIADLGKVDQHGWQSRELLFGNTFRAAGVDSTTSYSGIGHRAFHKALCLYWNGSTCAELYGRLWQPQGDGSPALADALRLQTIVVQRKLIDDPVPPAGWHVVRRSDEVTVLRRDKPPPFPKGRLSGVSPALTAEADECRSQRDERVRFRRTGPGRATLVFARINWPGYRAEVDGVSVPVRSDPAGLVTVDVPDSVNAGEVRLQWTPPGQTLGLAGSAAGLAGALTLTLFQLRRRRRPPPLALVPLPRKETV